MAMSHGMSLHEILDSLDPDQAN